MFKDLLLTITLLTVPTRQRAASPEVQVLQAHGKLQLRKVTCEKEDSAMRQGKESKAGKEKVRNEEARVVAAGPKNEK